jgi:hypothetical protein
LDTGFTDERFPVGAHACLIYESEEERRSLMSKFLEAGLKDGERVLCLTDVMKPDELLDWLQGLEVELPSGPDADRFTVTDAESAYCKDGYRTLRTRGSHRRAVPFRGLQPRPRPSL